MATIFMDAIKNHGTHTVGNVNSHTIETLANGAVCTENIDNFTIVETGFDAETGERTCSKLKNKATRGMLIASPEERHFEFEQMCDFYNALGERARLIYLTEGKRFQSSAFSLDSTASGTLKNGLKAHWDVTTSKFLIHDGTHLDYAAAANKFMVVGQEDDEEYTIDGFDLVQLEVIQ